MCSYAESVSLYLLSLADTLYGPLHNKEAVKMFLEAIEQAKQQGGSVVYGGKVTYFYSAAFSALGEKKSSYVVAWAKIVSQFILSAIAEC